ncbi:MAG: hypothetical protein ACK5MT_09000 [Actinomycetales bacterium]
MSCSPDGSLIALIAYSARFNTSAIHLLDSRDLSVVDVLPDADIAGSNGWSPTGRYLMIHNHGEAFVETYGDLSFYDLHTHTRHRIDLTRANARAFGPRQQPAMLAWLDDTTIIISTLKGHTLIAQTLDLPTGHREPLLSITDPRLTRATLVLGVPDTTHIWEQLL